MTNPQHLLNVISIIVKNDIKIQNERAIRGDKFNIFSVLGLSKHEVKLHSKIISELLNTKGSHGLKDEFLKAFIEITGLTDLNFNTKDSTSRIELTIGQINLSQDRGGRIDILIKSGIQAIIIENKIDATDQQNQLLRYFNYAKDKKYESRLLYLNINGSPPDEKSLGKTLTENDYIRISYKVHIKKWLERCIELSARQPLIRETLVQYAGIVNHITNQTMDTDNQNEIIELISNNFTSAAQIFNNYDLAKNKILTGIKDKINTILKDRIGSEFEIINDDNGKYSQIWIKFHDKKIPENLFFGVECFRGNNDFFMGIFDNKRESSLINEAICPESERLSNYWINFLKITIKGNNINFNSPDLLEKLQKDRVFKEEFIEEISNSIINYVNKKAPLLIEHFNH